MMQVTLDHILLHGYGDSKDYDPVAVDADADAAVHFDTVSLHNIASDAATSSETVGDQNSGNALTYATNGGRTNWVGAVYYNTKSDYTSTTTTTGYSCCC